MSDPGAGLSDQVFAPRNVIAVVLVSVFAFAAFVTLLAFAPDLQRDIMCRPKVYSRCAVGFAGLRALLREDGALTTVSRTALPAGETQGLLIVTPEPEQENDITGLKFAGPVLVVLPKWRTEIDPGQLSWGRKAGLIEPEEMPQKNILAEVKVARRTGVARPRLTGAAGTPFEGVVLTPGPVDQLQSLWTKDWIPVLTDETGQVVMARAPSAQIYVLAEPDLLDTQGLANLDTLTSAVTIVRALRAGDGAVIFDVTLNGYKIDRSLLKLMLQPPFLAVTLCLVAALALAGWQAAVRFGAVREAGRAFALGKEALTDNSAQLIRLARREPKMAPRYALLTRAAAARAVGAPRELAGAALTEFLDRLGAQRGAADTLAGLTGEAERVADRKSLTRLAGRLYQWRLEMTRERR